MLAIKWLTLQMTADVSNVAGCTSFTTPDIFVITSNGSNGGDDYGMSDRLGDGYSVEWFLSLSEWGPRLS